MPSETRELYTGEVYEWDFQRDRWVLILTSWGYPVTDNRIFIDGETLFQKGWKKEDIPPSSQAPKFTRLNETAARDLYQI